MTHVTHPSDIGILFRWQREFEMRPKVHGHRTILVHWYTREIVAGVDVFKCNTWNKQHKSNLRYIEKFQCTLEVKLWKLCYGSIKESAGKTVDTAREERSTAGKVLKTEVNAFDLCTVLYIHFTVLHISSNYPKIFLYPQNNCFTPNGVINPGLKTESPRYILVTYIVYLGTLHS